MIDSYEQTKQRKTKPQCSFYSDLHLGMKRSRKICGTESDMNYACHVILAEDIHSIEQYLSLRIQIMVNVVVR